jgi:hypothetical protein
MSQIVFRLIDSATGAPLGGVLLSSVGGPGPWQALADADGRCRTELAPGSYTITCSKAGYVDRILPADLADAGTITVGLEKVAIAAPVPGPVPSLVLSADGNDFVDATGRRVSYPGIDGFTDFRYWLDRRDDGLRPFMRETQANRLVVRRVLLAGALSENHYVGIHPWTEPGFHDQIEPYVRYANSFGIVPMLTVNVDMQHLDPLPTAADRLENWRTINSTLRGKGLAYVMSAGNEHDKNGYDPYGDIDDPGAGVIWSRGSSLEDQQTPPRGAPASELHATRVSWDRTLMDAVASPINMRAVSQSTMCWMTETMPFTADTDPVWHERLGRAYAILWAIAIHHNRQSQTGQLMDGRIAEGVSRWARGFTF